LLANIVLNQLTGSLTPSAIGFVRYADDFVILCPSRPEAEEALTCAKDALARLGLSLSLEKTRITPTERVISFLGFILSFAFQAYSTQVAGKVQGQRARGDRALSQSRP